VSESAHEQAHAPQPIRTALVLAAIGVVFGDIGTSPLYTIQECLAGEHGVRPDDVNVFGVVSLIFWSLTFVVTIKYLFFLMRADNQGEGGIMALLALVPEKLTKRHGGITLVTVLVIVGAALLFGDGIITPAISVLSAVEGLEVATTSLRPAVIPLTVVILFFLFLFQRRGTGQLGTFFGPVMTAWFVTIAVLGVAHIVREPRILGAILPHHALHFFVHNQWAGVRVLGGVVLAVTGGEALYADMGHFGRAPIRVGWLALIYPALLLCYFGQGATILADKAAAAQPFYAMVPQVMIYPMVILAAAATVIASQALISGVFSLTHQAIRLGYFPRLTVLHTSHEAEGQIYLPLINWGLAASCIALVLVFRESSKLAAAFGLAVSGTMLITSLTYHTVVRHTWGWPAARANLILAFFLSFDIPFVVANAMKFLDGGYLPFAVGLLFVIIMIVWRLGRGYVHDYLASESLPLEQFLTELDEMCLTRAPGTAVYLSSQPQGAPPSLVRGVRRFHVLHERILLLTVTTEHVPTVSATDRVEVTEAGKGVHRLLLRYGFMETPHIPSALVPILRSFGVDDPTTILYILGRETYVGTSANRMGEVSEKFFDFLSRNARRPTDFFGIPPDQVMELGSYVDL
jgi:KUP system potassium uptake protein